MANWQSQKSTPEVLYPFGKGLPTGQAQGAWGGFAGPLSAAFGVDPNFRNKKREGEWQQQYQAFQNSNSPLAQYMRQAQGFLPSMFGQAQQSGQKIASLGSQTFDMLKNQIGGSLKALPGMQRTAAGATNMAQNAANQAFSPIASQALFQNALQQSLMGSQQGAAARGLMDSGYQQGQEQDITRQLAGQYAQNQFQNQQAALQGLQGAQQNQAAMQMLGPQLAQAQAGALPGLQQALQAGYQSPMDAISQVFQQFAAFQNPNLALLGMTSPQVASRSQGSGVGIL